VLDSVGRYQVMDLGPDVRRVPVPVSFEVVNVRWKIWLVCISISFFSCPLVSPSNHFFLCFLFYVCFPNSIRLSFSSHTQMKNIDGSIVSSSTLFSVASPSTPDPRLLHTAGRQFSFPYAPQIHPSGSSPSHASLNPSFTSSEISSNTSCIVFTCALTQHNSSRKVRDWGTTL